MPNFDVTPRAVDRRMHAVAPLAGAGGVEPLRLAVLDPAHHADVALAMMQPGVEQIAGLGLAGRRATVSDDQVEAIIGIDAADRHPLVERLDISLDRLFRAPAARAAR